jgi:EAL domain-containing protein (putative c-di-GMP-specific phosphodiesterase class I)/GGDEF domain-containing protein
MGRLDRSSEKSLTRPAALPKRPANEAASGPDRSQGHSGKKGADQLRRQWLAYGLKYDVQTGLLNTQSFQEAVEGMLRQPRSEHEGVALLWIDLLNLRKAFTLWGWAGADALVRHVAAITRACVEEDSLVGRFSRSIVVAMHGAKADPATRRRIETVLDSLTQPVPGFDVVPEVAAGVAFYPADSGSGDDLARYASLAASIAGDNLLHAVLPFQDGMNNRLMRDHEMEVEIEKAIEQGHLRMAYQPKVDLVTGQVLGAEALIRWMHPEWGEVPPTEFIPIAERSALIHRIFDFGLRRTLEDTQVWLGMGVAPPVVSLNVSPANLRHNDFPRRVRQILSEFPVSPTNLELEVTESLLLDDEKLFRARLRQLKTIGVRIAIDDFGTRYTGFELLGRLPLDTMKIDQCFIRGIHRSRDLRALCNTIVAMAKHLKMRTVAEGIEEPEELEILQQIGCEGGQGFLIQPPATSDEFSTFQRTWPQRSQSMGFATAKGLPEIAPLCGIS